MKILGILGSQSQTGITAQMLAQVLDHVSPGVEVERVFLEDYQIHPAGVKEDNDLDELVAKLAASDVWVWAAPTYWRGISGIMKKFLDCLRPKLVYIKANGDTIPGDFKNKHYLTLTNCYASTTENWLTGVTDETFKTVDRVMTAAGVIKVGEIVCPNTLKLEQLPLKKQQLCAHYGPKISHQERKDDSTMKRYLQLFVMIAVMAFLTMGIQQLLRNLMPWWNFWLNYVSFTLIFFVLLAVILHFVTFVKHRRR
ncbi:flavodoxin family protein [Lactobacillus sp. DCY120]|uniref:Flavodoxin family protein n=1 Tax=Bombilactobacillus apium TaxID=2675299 RepID=A0A850R2L1_9LACO|nr:NAD(P)H-dependent oxidoreductase [Bombilactobacillus apium]NVY96251.1 flavodoxin family protein [Bombilactobacillus apium]